MSQIETWTDKLADLAVYGANVQPGQLVAVTSYIGKEALTRKIARAAYAKGARYVDVVYFDQWLKRERIALADADSLEYIPPWMSERLLYLSDEHAARITLSGPHAPRALDGLDPARAGRDLLPYLPETSRGREPHDDELVPRAGADRSLGRSRLPRPLHGRRVREAMGDRRAHLPARR